LDEKPEFELIEKIINPPKPIQTPSCHSVQAKRDTESSILFIILVPGLRRDDVWMPAFAGMTVGNIYLLRKKKLCYFDIQFIGKNKVRM
jgi:hypothetical protein